jgi:hypothetical protein
MSLPGHSDDDHVKSSQQQQPLQPPPPPPPAAHCSLTTAMTQAMSHTDDIKPLDLSIKTSEQPLNLSSKRKRNTPISLSKRNNSSLSSSVSTSVPTTMATTSTTKTSSSSSSSSPSTSPASSMFIPFYAISPFFDPTMNNQQEMLQQFQTFYLQLQQKFHKNE